MMRLLSMPDGELLRIPKGWDVFTYHGQTYRCFNSLVYVWRGDGWYPCPMATLRVAA